MRTLVAVALGLALVACDDSTGPSGPVGTFHLQSISGDPVPSTIVQSTNYLLEVTASSVTIRSNGTYTLTFTYRENDAGTISTDTDESTGTWTQSGNDLTFTDDFDDSTVDGTLSGSTLTINDGFDVFVYRR